MTCNLCFDTTVPSCICADCVAMLRSGKTLSYPDGNQVTAADLDLELQDNEDKENHST